MTATAGLAQGPTQAAIYTLLKADSQLLALLPAGGIYDDVPDALESNYVAFGEWTEHSDDTLEDDNAGIGSDMTLSLHIYTDEQHVSGGPRYSVAQAIASRIKVLLHETTLSISGFTCVQCSHENTIALRDEDEQGRPKRHLISTYRVLAEAS
jgi:hypothetical protein